MNSLHLATQLGNLQAIDRILISGVDVDLRDSSRRTALHHAATSNQLGAIKFLLTKGIDASARDATGRSAFAVSLFAPHFDVNILTALAGPTMASQASRGAVSDLSLLPSLLSGLVGIPALDKSTILSANFLLDLGALVNKRDSFGHTPLMLLCKRGDSQVQLVVRLLMAGADAGALDTNGLSVLRHAMQSSSGNLVNYLVQRAPSLAPSTADFAPFTAAPAVVSGYLPKPQPTAPANHLLAARPLSKAEHVAARRRMREGQPAPLHSPHKHETKPRQRHCSRSCSHPGVGACG